MSAEVVAAVVVDDPMAAIFGVDRAPAPGSVAAVTHGVDVVEHVPNPTLPPSVELKAGAALCVMISFPAGATTKLGSVNR